MTQQLHPASTAAFLSSKGIPHHTLLPPVPLYHLLAANRSLPWNCSPVPVQLPVTAHSGELIWGTQGHSTDCMVIIPSDCHRPAASLSDSLKCFLFVPTDCSDVRLSPLLQLLHPWVQVHSHSLSSSFPLLPLSCQLFHGFIYYFLEVRDSCHFSGGIL